MGAKTIKVQSIAELESALAHANGSDVATAIVIDTDPWPSTEAGGTWWDVGIPEVSVRTEVQAARQKYELALAAHPDK